MYVALPLVVQYISLGSVRKALNTALSCPSAYRTAEKGKT